VQWTETFFGALFMKLVVALRRVAKHCVPASEVIANVAKRVFVHALLVRQKAFVADLNITHGACWGSVAAALLANRALWVTIGIGVFLVVNVTTLFSVMFGLVVGVKIITVWRVGV